MKRRSAGDTVDNTTESVSVCVCICVWCPGVLVLTWQKHKGGQSLAVTLRFVTASSVGFVCVCAHLSVLYTHSNTADTADRILGHGTRDCKVLKQAVSLCLAFGTVRYGL